VCFLLDLYVFEAKENGDSLISKVCYREKQRNAVKRKYKCFLMLIY